VPLGRFDEAIAEVKRAVELDPLSLIINSDLGNTYYNARRYDEAIEQLRKPWKWILIFTTPILISVRR